jgi:hypothetical protein
MHLFSIWEPSTDPSQQDFSPGVGFLFLFYFIFFVLFGGRRTRSMEEDGTCDYCLLADK